MAKYRIYNPFPGEFYPQEKVWVTWLHLTEEHTNYGGTTTHRVCRTSLEAAQEYLAEFIAADARNEEYKRDRKLNYPKVFDYP